MRPSRWSPRDQQRAARAGTGRRATARGRASRPRARRRGRCAPRRRAAASRSGVDRAARCRSARAAPALCPAPRAAPRARRAGGAISMRRCEHGLGVLRRARRVLVARVHPHLAARALDDRRRLPAVVDVRVGDHEQAHVLEAQVDLVHRPLEVRASTPARACPRRPARRRRRPRPPTRCSAARRATGAAGAGARRRGARARRGRPRACGSACHRARTIRGLLTPTAWAKRGRARGRAERLEAPTSEYTSEGGDVLVAPRRADARRRGAQYAATFARQPALAGGRLAARGRVPLRAPRGALGDRRASPIDGPEGAARALPLRDARTSAASIRDTLREHLAEHFPDMEAP